MPKGYDGPYFADGFGGVGSPPIGPRSATDAELVAALDRQSAARFIYLDRRDFLELPSRERVIIQMANGANRPQTVALTATEWLNRQDAASRIHVVLDAALLRQRYGWMVYSECTASHIPGAHEAVRRIEFHDEVL